MIISIVIVNYNGGRMVIDTIDSVVHSMDSLKYEVIVVDNASLDGSHEAIKKTFGEQVLFVEMGRNAGFAAANNAGVKKASGKYILFLNPDTIVLSNAIQTLVNYMESHPDVGACGGNLYNIKHEPNFSYWMLLPGWKMEMHSLLSNVLLQLHYHGSHQHNLTNQPKDVGYIMGADLMVTREVIDKVGCFDEDFFLFYEETELCYRIHKAGYKIMNIPAAHIIHLEGQTIDKMNIRLQQMMSSRAKYLRKCCSAPERHLANSILVISSILRIGWFALCGNRDKVNFWKYTLTHI